MINMLNLQTFTGIFCCLLAIFFIAKGYSRICSNNKLFDKRCNDLEKYQLRRSDSEEIVGKDRFGATTISRDALLGKVNY